MPAPIVAAAALTAASKAFDLIADAAARGGGGPAGGIAQDLFVNQEFPDDKWFYIKDPSSDKFLGSKWTEIHSEYEYGDGDMMLKPVNGGPDFQNYAAKFMFYQGMLICKCNKFKRHTSTHVVGVAEGNPFPGAVFACWDGDLLKTKYRVTNISSTNPKVQCFKFDVTQKFLNGTQETGTHDAAWIAYRPP